MKVLKALAALGIAATLFGCTPAAPEAAEVTLQSAARECEVHLVPGDHNLGCGSDVVVTIVEQETAWLVTWTGSETTLVFGASGVYKDKGSLQTFESVKLSPFNPPKEEGLYAVILHIASLKPKA